MNQYESIIIVNPNVDEAGLKALEEKFTGLINENGKVESVENMGKKKLAYEIKKGSDTYKSGYYYVINLESNDDKAVKEFDRLALISSDVIRHLVIRKEK